MKTNTQLYNDFFNKIGIEETGLLSMVRSQYNEVENFMKNKRNELDTNFQLYKNVIT